MTAIDELPGKGVILKPVKHVVVVRVKAQEFDLLRDLHVIDDRGVLYFGIEYADPPVFTVAMGFSPAVARVVDDFFQARKLVADFVVQHNHPDGVGVVVRSTAAFTC